MHLHSLISSRELRNLVAVVTKPLHSMHKDIYVKCSTFLIFGNTTLVLYLVIVRLHLCAKILEKCQIK